MSHTEDPLITYTRNKFNKHIPPDEQWEQLYMKASAERDKLKAQRNALLAAAKAAKKYLEPDLVEPGRTVFWNLVAAIEEAEK
jgi:hypothetical protein